MPGRGPSPRIDWKKAERLYRQGLLSNVEIARQCNATESSIRSKAKEKGWTKDLTHDMRTKARIKMVENLAQYADPNKVLDGMHDEQITEEAARTQVNVVREHQQTLKQGHGLTVRMLNELDATTAYMGELQQLITSTVAPMRQEALRRAVSLGQRATIMRDLATAARLWVQMERQAFSIVDESKNPEVKDLDNKSAEELRAEIMDDAKKMGLDISDLGVAKSGDKVH
jgi:hypothetical protein